MANRNTLSVNQVEKFKAFLVADGWKLQEPKGDYEVLRATKEDRKHTLIAYSRLATNGGKQIQHLTLADRDMPIVRAFLKNKLRRKGNERSKQHCQTENTSFQY